MKCSLVGWASHLLFTFNLKTSLKKVLNELNSAKWPGWPGLLQPITKTKLFSALTKKFRDVFGRKVNNKCDAQPTKEHLIFN